MDSRIEERLNSYDKSIYISIIHYLIELNSIPYKEIEERSCTLRKKRLESEFMKKRLVSSAPKEQNNQAEYAFDINSLSIPKHFLEKNLNGLEDLLQFVSELLKETNKDDFIAFGIFLLKNYPTINDEKVLDKYEIDTLILTHLQNKLNNIIFTNELIWLLINLSFSPNQEISSLFATEKYLIIYKDILLQYQQDVIIKRNLLQLFGNLVSTNHKVQKSFCESKLFDLIFNNLKSISQEPLSIDKNLMLWFMACFTNKLRTNVYFLNNKSIVVSIQKEFIDNLYNEYYLNNCLLGLANISEFEYSEVIEAFMNNEGAIITYLFTLPNLHYQKVNIIICNLSSIDNDIDKRLVQYGFLDFIKQGLLSESYSIQSEALWSLSNVITNCDMVKLINDKGIIPIIIPKANSYSKLLVTSSIEALTNIIIESDAEFANVLFQYNFTTVLIELLAKNIDEKILIKSLEALSMLLEKSKNSRLFIDDIERKGGKEVFNRLAMSSMTKLAEMANQILEKYCNTDYDSNSNNCFR